MAKSSDVITIRINPWVVATFILSITVITLLFMQSRSFIGAEAASEKLVAFLEQSESAPEGSVKVLSSKREGSLYKVTLMFQGREVELFMSGDGNSLIPDVVDLSGTVPEAIELDVTSFPIKGSPDAPITLVEFSDFQCPFCGRFFSETLPLLQSEYIDKGLVKLYYLDFPLPSHPEAQKAAEAAHCVRGQLGDEGYYQMHDLLFENINSLSVSNYKIWAKSLNLDGALFDTCLDSGETASIVSNASAMGRSVGVTGTPSFLINGQVISGAQPFEVFDQVIKAELEKSTS